MELEKKIVKSRYKLEGIITKGKLYEVEDIKNDKYKLVADNGTTWVINNQKFLQLERLEMLKLVSIICLVSVEYLRLPKIQRITKSILLLEKIKKPKDENYFFYLYWIEKLTSELYQTKIIKDETRHK